MKTELSNRTLWYDGTSQVNPDDVPEFILAGVPVDKIVVKELNSDIELLNSLADDPITCEKSENSEFQFSWNIPDRYKNLDLAEYSLNALVGRRGITPDGEYLDRLRAEWKKIHEYRLDDLFRSLIYVIRKLEEEKKVWGVGRGSSCASLFLYAIGLHEVDPVKHKIPPTEFFHE